MSSFRKGFLQWNTFPDSFFSLDGSCSHLAIRVSALSMSWIIFATMPISIASSDRLASDASFCPLAVIYLSCIYHACDSPCTVRTFGVRTAVSASRAQNSVHVTFPTNYQTTQNFTGFKCQNQGTQPRPARVRFVWRSNQVYRTSLEVEMKTLQ